MNDRFPLVRYTAMRQAVAECHSVDECKDIHDKALAIELYARQAKDVETERRACECRIRAERRVGELLRGMQRTQGVRTDKLPATIAGSSDYRKAIESAQINERTARRWQQLAGVPQEQFEAALAGTTMPTTTGIITDERAKAPPSDTFDPVALWVWGRLRDAEREGITAREPRDVWRGMTETMQRETRRILPDFLEWLSELVEVAK